VGVRLWNDATTSADDATNVRAEISWTDPNGEAMTRPARPGDQAEYPTTGAEPRVRIEAKGNQLFNVATRFRGETDAYIVNSKSMALNDARDRVLILPTGSHEIILRVFPDEGGPNQWRFLLRNEMDAPLALVPLPEAHPSSGRLFYAGDESEVLFEDSVATGYDGPQLGQ